MEPQRARIIGENMAASAWAACYMIMMEIQPRGASMSLSYGARSNLHQPDQRNSTRDAARKKNICPN
jgi:hypothetical protein